MGIIDKEYYAEMIKIKTHEDYELEKFKIDMVKKSYVDHFANRNAETPHDKVIRLLKGDFEKTHGITFEKFIETYNDILENNPEKLI
jgi:hypothetical protein